MSSKKKVAATETDNTEKDEMSPVVRKLVLLTEQAVTAACARQVHHGDVFNAARESLLEFVEDGRRAEAEKVLHLLRAAGDIDTRVIAGIAYLVRDGGADDRYAMAAEDFIRALHRIECLNEDPHAVLSDWARSFVICDCCEDEHMALDFIVRVEALPGCQAEVA